VKFLSPGDTEKLREDIIIIAGPTASGKTAVSVELALKIDGEIISADSRQVYRFLDVGSAKPTISERKGVRHYGFDVVDPDVWYSAGRYANEARGWIKEIQARKKRIIIVGGSGLYLQALIDGFFSGSVSLRAGDPSCRQERLHYQSLEKKGLASLYDELQRVDPIYAEKTSRKDRQRILRALKTYYASGIPFSQLLTREREALPMPTLWFGLNWKRELLYKRIEKRVDEMFDRGLVSEVRSLLDRGYRETNALKSLGYVEVIVFLDGTISSFKDVRNLVIQNTRHFAKRQLTWFRKNQRIRWMDPANFTAEQIAEKIARDVAGASRP